MDVDDEKVWLEQREVERQDREAATTTVCPKCEHVGMGYGRDNLNQPWFRCPACGEKEYI